MKVLHFISVLFLGLGLGGLVWQSVDATQSEVAYTGSPVLAGLGLSQVTTETATMPPTATQQPTGTTEPPTDTPIPTMTETTEPTASPTMTQTPSLTFTATSTPTATSTSTPTSAFTPTSTPTLTATDTATPTVTPTATLTPTITLTPIPVTPTPTPTPTGAWVKDAGNPVLGLGAGLDWDGGAVFAPAVLIDAQGFQMWYTGRVATGTAGVVTAVGRATSADGTDWMKDRHNPVLADGVSGEWDADGAGYASVLRIDGTYHLWYAGRDAAGMQRIGYATSPDGVQWTKHAANPVLEPGLEGAWDARGVRPGTVLWIDGIYHMWYTGVGPDGAAQIGYAISPDGVNWARYAGNPVLRAEGAGWDALGVYRPAVLYAGTTYRMWYTGVGSAGVPHIGAAASTDRIHWTRGPAKPVLAPGGLDAWDAAGVAQPALLFDRESLTYHMWYTGGSGGVWRIGHATRRAGRFVYLALIGRN